MRNPWGKKKLMNRGRKSGQKHKNQGFLELSGRGIHYSLEKTLEKPLHPQ